MKEEPSVIRVMKKSLGRDTTLQKTLLKILKPEPLLFPDLSSGIRHPLVLRRLHKNEGHHDFTYLLCNF